VVPAVRLRKVHATRSLGLREMVGEANHSTTAQTRENLVLVCDVGRVSPSAAP
jgi:hypothetical protein